MSYFSDARIDKMGAVRISQADFKLFLSLWNQLQNQATPALHFRIADWLEHRWNQGDKELLLMVFRSAGKSTLAGVFCAWLLYRNSNLRILVLAADQALAGKMVRNVKRVIERHPLCQAMRPKNADQWASDRFTIRRSMELRDPSMLARGIGANLTGSRADIVICDDVEVPNTSDSADKRADLRERLAEISYILVPGGTQFYIGTPHHYYSIYADRPRTEIGEEKIFLNGFKRLEIPVMDVTGNSLWPERFSEKALARMKRQSGPNKFNSQMMLKPVNIAQGRLNPQAIQYYDHALHYSAELSQLFIGQTRMISASAFWDPAFGSASGDHSVLAVIYADENGNLYLHRLEYIKLDPRSDIDEANQQCKIVAEVARQGRLPSLAVEINGIGRFLPGILRNALTLAKAPCAVKEVSSKQNKETRILEAFDAVLASRRLYVHEAIKETLFLAEMQDWRPTGSKGHDDGLDAVAGAILQEPVRIKRLYGKGGHHWQGCGKTHTAKTDFKL